MTMTLAKKELPQVYFEAVLFSNADHILAFLCVRRAYDSSIPAVQDVCKCYTFLVRAFRRH